MARLRSVLVFCIAAVSGLFTSYANGSGMDYGGNIELPADGRNIIITSPEFPAPYPNNSNCHWTVTAPPGLCVRADALYWSLSTMGSTFVIFNDKGPETTHGIRQAYNYGQPAPFGWQSRTSIIDIGFGSRSDSNGRGFQLALRAKPCNTACVEKEAPRHIVNLDESPLTRWCHIIEQYPFINISTYGMLNVFDYFSENKWYPFTGSFSEQRKATVLDYHSRLPADLRDELTGISTCSKVPLEFIVMANVLYETVTGCTSIVASDARGRPIHGRNLDFRGTANLRDDTIHVDFTRNGKTVYSFVTFAGAISIMTAQKPGVFTYSLNRRITSLNTDRNLEIFRNPAHTTLLKVVRETLETATSYDQAVSTLSDALLPSPCYLIIGGTQENEGVILTRAPEGPIDVYPIDVSNSRWYVAQTNTDRWAPFDNRTDPFSPQNRLELAHGSLNRTGRFNMDFPAMMEVTATPAVYNHATVFSTVMGASNPTGMSTRVRCPLPVFTPATRAASKLINARQRV